MSANLMRALRLSGNRYSNEKPSRVSKFYTAEGGRGLVIEIDYIVCNPSRRRGGKKFF